MDLGRGQDVESGDELLHWCSELHSVLLQSLSDVCLSSRYTISYSIWGTSHVLWMEMREDDSPQISTEPFLSSAIDLAVWL